MIDRSTVDRVLAAADIVDVVGDFVTLRRSGANFKGLCPFHDEKTPSFMVSPSKQLCKCFSCGNGGNVVKFVMLHEQLTFPEAIKWLGRRYGIEVRDKELSDAERATASAREAMFVVNEWARDYFVETLHNNVDGVAVGMSYFRRRGLRDDIIRKFQLGYALEQRDALAHAAKKKGFEEKYLESTGLCYRTDDGKLLDRYHGRVIFPVHSVSGRVVAFGGRVLNTGAESAEAVFDPETGELMEAPSEGANLLRVLDAVQIDPEYARAASAALTSLATAALSVPVEGAEVSQLRGDKDSEPGGDTRGKEGGLSSDLPESCAAELHELGIRPATEIIEPLSEDAAALAGIDEHALARVTAALSERLAGVLFAPDAASAEQSLHLLAENTLAGQCTMWRIFDPAGTEHTRYSLLYPAEGASPLELAAAYRAASQVVTRTRAELDEAEQAVQQAQTAAESAVEAEREAAKAAGVASAEHARARAQAESLEASAQNIQAERARLNERLAAAEESVAQARTAYESARTREDSYLAGTGEQAPAATIERRAQRLGEVLAEQVSEREQQLHELSTALKNAQEGLTSTNDEVQDLQAAHAAALTLLARTQTETARVQERVQALAERARLVTGLTLEQLQEEYSEQLPVDVPAAETSENAAAENSASENAAAENTATEASTESVRARLKATRAELEALGAINPLALEEYEALSERHAYLNQQIEDLKATRRDLNTVMDEVSSHIAEVFTAALEDINTHYRRIFETLFPGGEGHLELDDPSDPLNSGVEIHARPAGKKVKRLSLLSGGERSLASLALLIAIYMSRPSPFYALDEVEAALDDRNLSRLLQVIGELGERSQLIVVTHQKRTMQIAETLYGVSMRGGVSTVLSQQMEELRELL